MKRIVVVCSLLVVILAGCGKSPAGGPAKLDKTVADAVTREIEKDRAETLEWLRSNPKSYLAAIDRIDFGAKSMLSVGKADDNDVRLSADDIEPHHLRITVDGDRFRVESIDAKAGFKVKDEVKRAAMLDPSSIQIGRFHLRLSHQRYPAIIVFDPQSPRMKEYKGLEYFPVDSSYRYELQLTRAPKPENIVILSTRGNRRNAERMGWFDFLVGNTPCRLEAAHLIEPGSGADDLSVFFRDATSGKETYPLGRYVDAKKLPNGKYLLDFNTAYNPACAFSNYYNCPVPPKANTLTAAIRAGEKDSHYHQKSEFSD
jgi:uncharacterized protein